MNSERAVLNLFQGIYFENNHEYTPLKNLSVAVRQFLKLFLGVHFEKIHEYTFEQILLKSFGCFEYFPEFIFHK